MVLFVTSTLDFQSKSESIHLFECKYEIGLVKPCDVCNGMVISRWNADT